MCDIALSFTYIGKEIPTMRGINFDGIKKTHDNENFQLAGASNAI